MSNVIRNLLLKIGVDFTDAQKGFNKLAKEMKSVGKSLTKTGEAMTKSITLPVVGAVAGLSALTVKAASTADEINTLAAKFGLTTDQIQEMQYAAEIIDVDLETMGMSMQKLTKNMDLARKGSKDQIDAFKALGVEYKNADGTLRNAKDVWYDTIDALGAMSNEADRDAYSMRLFGKSAVEINPLIKAGSKELNKLSAEAHNVGAVISGDTLGSLNELQDMLDKAKQILIAATAEIANAFSPALKALQPIIINKIVPAIKKFADWLAGIFKWFESLSPSTQKFILLIGGIVVALGPMLTIAGKLATVIGTDLVAALARATAAMATQGLAGAIAAFMGPAGIAVAVIAALAVVIGSAVIISNNFDEEIKQLRSDAEELTKTLKDAKSEFEDTTNNIDANAFAANKLADELYELDKKEVKSNADKAKMKQLVYQLNKLYPDLGLSINDVTGELNLSNNELRESINNMKMLAQATAYSNAYTTALANQAEAERQYNATKAKLDAQIAKEAEMYGETTDELWAQIEATGIASDEVTILLRTMKELRADYDSASESVDYYVQKLDGVSKSMGNAADAAKESSATMQTAVSQTYVEFAKSVTQAAKDIGSGFDEILSAQDLGMAASLRKMKKYAQDVAAWGQNIKSLAGRIPDDIYASLVKAGLSQAQTVADLANATPEQLQAWVDAWRDGASEMGKQVVDILSADPFIKSIKDAGKQVAFGFANGITDAMGQAIDAAGSMASGVVRRTKNVLQIQSPSKVTRGLGKFTTQGFALGLWDKAKEVFANAGKIAHGAASSLSYGGEFAYVGNVSGGGSANISTQPQFVGGDLNVNLSVDGRTIAQVTAPYMDAELSKKRTSISRGKGEGGRP